MDTERSALELFEMQGMCMFHGMKIFTDVASFTFLVKHESDSD